MSYTITKQENRVILSDKTKIIANIEITDTEKTNFLIEMLEKAFLKAHKFNFGILESITTNDKQNQVIFTDTLGEYFYIDLIEKNFKTSSGKLLTQNMANKLILDAKCEKLIDDSRPWLRIFCKHMFSSFVYYGKGSLAKHYLINLIKHPHKIKLLELLAKDGLNIVSLSRYSEGLHWLLDANGKSLQFDYTENTLREIIKMPKNLYYFCKQNNVEIDVNFCNKIDNIFRHEELFINSYPYYIQNNMLDNLYYKILNVMTCGCYDDLLNKYGYDKQKLFSYIFNNCLNQGIDNPHESILLLRDYAKMTSQVVDKFDKFPRFLKTMHDIATMNYNLVKNEIMSQKIAEIAETNKYLEYKDKNWTVILPQNQQDFIEEGIVLSHCAKSYADKVARGECLIVFVRNSKDVKSPLLTVQIQNSEIAQAKGYANRNPNESEKLFLNKYCKLKGLKNYEN